MRKIIDLKAEEFPGADPQKFEQWKEMRSKGEKLMLYLIIGITGLFLILVFTEIIGGFVVVLLIILTPIIIRSITLSPSNRLASEIGIKEKDIRSALKRKDFN